MYVADFNNVDESLKHKNMGKQGPGKKQNNPLKLINKDKKTHDLLKDYRDILK